MTIRVENVNRAPVFLTGTTTYRRQEGELLVFEVVALDDDGDRALTLQANALPQGARFEVATLGFTIRGRFSWMPNDTQAGEYSVLFRASDGEWMSDQRVSIDIQENQSLGNQPPRVTRCTVWSWLGRRVYFFGKGSGSDGQIVAYSWRSSTDGQLSTASSFTTRKLSVGEHTIYFKVQDNEGVWSKETTRKVTVKKVRR